jgi:hypothetical protein
MLENNNENKTYISVYDGKFTVKSDPSNPKAKERTNKNGAKVYELLFDSISGFLENVQDFKIENPSGSFRNIVFTIRDKEEVYSLSTPYSSRESKGILLRLPNINLKNPVKVKIAKKDHPFTWVTQDDVTVPAKWTKDNPGSLPPMVKVEIDGKENLDDTEQMKFLFEYIQTNVFAKSPSSLPVQGFSSPPLPPVSPTEDDLPF